MSRLAQQVQAMTDELRKKAKQKKGRSMDDTIGGDNLTGDINAEDVNTESQAQDAGGDIEPDAAPAGAEVMNGTKKAAKGSKKTTSKAKPKAAKSAKSAKPAKVAKLAKSAKAAKAPKAAKTAKEAKPKVVIGALCALGELGKVVSIDGGERNQFVNLTFSNGMGFKLWPSGYAKPEDRLKARDLMVAWLQKVAQ